MRVEDVVNIAGQDELDVGRGGSGESFDQAEQVLVRAEPADVEEIALIRRNRKPTENRAGSPGRPLGAGRSGSGPSVITRIL